MNLRALLIAKITCPHCQRRMTLKEASIASCVSESELHRILNGERSGVSISSRLKDWCGSTADPSVYVEVEELRRKVKALQWNRAKLEEKLQADRT